MRCPSHPDGIEWHVERWAFDFDDWDTDDDGRLTEREFQDGVFDVWDGDADGQLSERETGVGLFEAWDDNNDDLIDQDEYRGRAA